MYYKNKENQPYFEPSKEIIKRDGLVEIAKEEFEQIVYEINNPPLAEEQRIQQIEAKCNQAIESVYPIYKQINITNLLNPYTEQDRDIMKAFIDSKRAICHKAIEDGTNPEDVDFSNES